MPRRLRSAKPSPRDDGSTEFSVGGRVVARLYWHDTGTIERETNFDADGRMHGAERERFEQGNIKYLASWSHGRQVGWQQQWSEAGKLLVRTRFVRGSGLDAWFDARLAETRTLVDGDRHGFEHWWAAGDRVWSERHWKHGIARQWSDAGRLERGYPLFWIDGKRATRRQYERAYAADMTLPPIRVGDDKPKRKPPKLIE